MMDGLTWNVVVQLVTAIGVIATAVLGVINRNKLDITTGKVDEVHHLTNSMKDELIANLTAKFDARIADLKNQLAAAGIKANIAEETRIDLKGTAIQERDDRLKMQSDLQQRGPR